MEIEVVSHLTKKQKEILRPLFDHFDAECAKGLAGSIIMQVDGEGKTMKGAFLPHEKTVRITAILDETGDKVDWEHPNVKDKKEALSRDIAKRIYDYMNKDLKNPINGDWVHGPREFLPANVCVDFEAYQHFLNTLAKMAMEVLEPVYIVLEERKAKDGESSESTVSEGSTGGNKAGDS